MTPFFISYRVRRAPLVQLAEMGSRALWGFLVLLDPRAWQERMETRCGNPQTLDPIFPDKIDDLDMLPISTPVLTPCPAQVLSLMSHLPSPCRVRWETLDRRALKGIRVNM